MALDNPLFVVHGLESPEGSLQALDTRAGFQPEQVFLRSADESLGAAVALR